VSVSLRASAGAVLTINSGRRCLPLSRRSPFRGAVASGNGRRLVLTGRWSRSRVVADHRATSRDRDENRERGPSPPSSAWPRSGVGVGLPAAPRAERVRRRAVLRYGCVVVARHRRPRSGAGDQPAAHVLPAAAGVRESLGARGARHGLRMEGRGPLRRCGRGGASPLREVGWWYPWPDPRYPSLIDRVAVYRVRSRRSRWTVSAWWRSPAASCGGWIAGDVVGPFKGEPGSWGW
jgi:hypothetical protein